MKNVIKREQCKLACELPNVNILSKVTKFKVLLYLKKGSTDKRGKAPIMGRITLNNSIAQFSCKLSCTPNLWNPRSGRLEGKSREAVDVNASGGRLLLSNRISHSNFAPEKDAKGNGMDMLTILINSIRFRSGLLCSTEHSKVCSQPLKTPLAAENSLLCRGLWLTSEVGLPVLFK
ncbi:MAG: hypothetical protein IJ562_09500 [Prevotella sp.]|nr:hypothetical protein [Prevotella sp.]